MKKNTLKRAISAAAVSALAVSVSSVSAFAAITDKGMAYTVEPKDGSASAIKPTLTASKLVYDTAAEIAGKNVTIEFTLDGAAQQYSTTGIHFQWDDRLTVVPNPVGLYAESGAALKYADQSTAENNGKNGVFVASGAQSDTRGANGVMWTVEVKVPADAKAGDVFPIDIYFDTAGENARGDLFRKQSDKAETQESKLMQAYFFTQGINSSQTNPSTDPVLVNAPKTDSTFTTAPIFADGYIAIKAKDNTPETTTTAPPVTTPVPTTAPVATKAPETTTAPPVTTPVPTTAPVATTAPETTTASTGVSTGVSTTTAQTTTGKSGSKDKASDSPKTGVTGVGVAVAGLAVAVGTAFALKKKED